MLLEMEEYAPRSSRRKRRVAPETSCGRRTSRMNGTGGSTRRTADRQRQRRAESTSAQKRNGCNIIRQPKSYKPTSPSVILTSNEPSSCYHQRSPSPERQQHLFSVATSLVFLEQCAAGEFVHIPKPWGSFEMLRWHTRGVQFSLDRLAMLGIAPLMTPTVSAPPRYVLTTMGRSTSRILCEPCQPRKVCMWTVCAT